MKLCLSHVTEAQKKTARLHHGTCEHCGLTGIVTESETLATNGDLVLDLGIIDPRDILPAKS